MTGTLLDIDWILVGSRLDLGWILLGPCLDLDWVLVGSWFDLDLVLVGIGLCVGFHLVNQSTLVGSFQFDSDGTLLASVSVTASAISPVVHVFNCNQYARSPYVHGSRTLLRLIVLSFLTRPLDTRWILGGS